MNISMRMATDSNPPQRQQTWKAMLTRRASFLLIGAMLTLPPVAFGKTIYFHHDAESSPISDNYGKSTDRWSDSSSLVSRSQQVVKNGSWALRHEITDPAVDNQTGKVIKFWNPHPAEAYYSAWYYIKEGYEDNKWKNIMQWKTVNTNKIAGGVKTVIGPHVINGLRQLTLGVVDCELPEGSFPQYQANGPCGFRQLTNPMPVPKNTWFHIETYYKATKTNGHIIVWQDGVEIFNISHPNLDLLTRQSKNDSSLRSDNDYLYFGIGNYVSEASQPPLHVLYTDDGMITDYPVHLDSTADTTPPSAPTGLAIVP